MSRAIDFGVQRCSCCGWIRRGSCYAQGASVCTDCPGPKAALPPSDRDKYALELRQAARRAEVAFLRRWEAKQQRAKWAKIAGEAQEARP